MITVKIFLRCLWYNISKAPFKSLILSTQGFFVLTLSLSSVWLTARLWIWARVRTRAWVAGSARRVGRLRRRPSAARRGRRPRATRATLATPATRRSRRCRRTRRTRRTRDDTPAGMLRRRRSTACPILTVLMEQLSRLLLEVSLYLVALGFVRC